MIGLTGATGEIGKLTLTSLLDAGAKLCFLVRDPKKIHHFLNQYIKKNNCDLRGKVEVRPFDFNNFNRQVFKQIKVLLWILPNNHNTMDFNESRWLALAKKSGVKHIVKLSAVSAADSEDDFFEHRHSEKNVEQSKIPFTHLRANAFMQNFNKYELSPIKLKRELRFPTGDAKVSFIDVRDVSQVAAKILLNPKQHVNKAYTLTGDEALSYPEVADLFTATLDIKVRYVNTATSYYAADQYKNMHPLYAAVKRGKFSGITKHVETILGQPPKKLVQYIKDYSDYFLANVSGSSS